MAFCFEAPGTAELRQGELLGDLYVHRAAIAASISGRESDPEVVSTHHPLVIVVHSDCDLLQDYNARAAARVAGAEFDPADKAAVPQVLFFEAFGIAEVRGRFNSELWKRVKQNQEERYHSLDFEPLGGDSAPVAPLVLDFRKALMVNTGDLYSGLQSGIRRLGVIPDVYVHDLMHRAFGYMSRVGLPE